MIESCYLDGLQIHDTATLALTEFEVGSPSPRVASTARALSHGALDRTRYYDGRVISLRGEVWAGDAVTFWGAVDALKGAFALSPGLKVLTWRREGLAYDERALVRAAGQLTLPLKAGTWWAEFGAELFAPDPRVYSATLSTASYDPTLAGSGSGVAFPLAFPLTFGSASSSQLVVDNAGNISTPPVLTVTGPVTNPIVDNDTTGESVYTEGLSLSASDSLVIDTATRSATINGTAVPQYIDAELTRWFELAPGQNLLRLRGTGMTTGQTLLTCTYRDARI